MRSRVDCAALVFALLAGSCAAQDWQIGGGGGYGFYRKATVFTPAGEAAAGIRSRFVLTAWITNDRYEHVSGEFRYTYHDGDPFLEKGGDQANIQGQSHSFEYDVLFHFRDIYKSVRPYLTTGLGVKRYVGNGPPSPMQSFTGIAELNDTHQTMVLGVLGVGLSVNLGRNVRLRFDVRDYITRFPKNLIRPAANGTGRGLFQQITPMIGVAYAFGSE